MCRLLVFLICSLRVGYAEDEGSLDARRALGLLIASGAGSLSGFHAQSIGFGRGVNSRSFSSRGASNPLMRIIEFKAPSPAPKPENDKPEENKDSASQDSASEDAATKSGEGDALRMPTKKGPTIVPRDKDTQIREAIAAVRRAKADGVTRFVLRLKMAQILPGESVYDARLVKPFEEWEGGISQEFGVCAPMVKDFLRKVTTDVWDAGASPYMLEEGQQDWTPYESVHTAATNNPGEARKGIGYAFCMPAKNRMPAVRRFHDHAGARPVFMINPDWKVGDDPLDYAYRQGGMQQFFAKFAGGGLKVEAEKEMEELGFVDTYHFHDYWVRGKKVELVLSYPYGWSVHLYDDATASFTELISGAKDRPRYQDVEEAMGLDPTIDITGR